MMAYADLKKVIPQILKNVSFHDYLSYKSYNLIEGKTFNGFQCYKKQTTHFDDIVYVGAINEQENFYSIYYSDNGNIIDFVKNRIEIEDYSESFSPEKDPLIEACKNLLYYLNERGESNMGFATETTKNDLNILKKTSFTKHFKSEKIFDFKYLNQLKINEETVNHPIFNTKVLNSRGFMFNNKFHDVINVAFPIYDINDLECGLYYENFLESDFNSISNLEFYAPYSVKTGIWISNEFKEGSNQKTAITIVDKPSEALSHFQYMKENRKYIAVFDLEEITIKQIIEQSNKGKSVIYLAFNVSIESFIKEIKILIAFLNVSHDITFVQNNTHDIWIKIGKKEEQFFTAFLKRIRFHNNKKISEVVKILGMKSENFIAKDLIKPTPNNDGDLMVKIPKNFKTLYKFEKILIMSFPEHIPIQIEKPVYKTWKNQNNKFYEAINDERTLEDYVNNEEVFILSSHRFNN